MATIVASVAQDRPADGGPRGLHRGAVGSEIAATVAEEQEFD